MRGWPIFVLCVAALCAGCAAGPDFVRPSAPAVNGYTPEALPERTASADIGGGEAQRFVQGLDLPGQWWTLFQSPALNALIERALRANPDLQSAQAALRMGRENALAQRGAFYPQAQGNFSLTRQKVGESISSPLNSDESIFNLHTAQVSVSYAPDVFGLNRRQVESLEAQAEAQRFQWEAAYLSLTTNVVAAAVQEASLRAQIAATQRIIGIETEQRDLIKRQLELGAVAEAALVAQEATLAQTQATLPPLQKQLAQQRNLLSALSGRYPSETGTEQFTLGALQLPTDLPVTLPSQLVQQRPDVRAAEAQLHAASAQVGVAIANMLPQFSLTANGGDMGTQIASLFSSANNFWTLAANVTQPIFQGGTLLHRKRAAQAAYDQAAAQYRGTVIQAFQNVADTLHALRYDAQGLEAAVAAEQASAKSLAIARRQLELGDISYLALLGSELAYQQVLLNRVQAQASRYADTAALFQALGGGWWNRSDNGAVSTPLTN